MLTYPKCRFFCWCEASCLWQGKALSQTLHCASDSSGGERREDGRKWIKGNSIKSETWQSSISSCLLINHGWSDWLEEWYSVIDINWKLLWRKFPNRSRRRLFSSISLCWCSKVLFDSFVLIKGKLVRKLLCAIDFCYIVARGLRLKE